MGGEVRREVSDVRRETQDAEREKTRYCLHAFFSLFAFPLQGWAKVPRKSGVMPNTFTAK